MRRKRLSPDLARCLERFRQVVDPIERAKRAAVEAVPSARAAGRPLGEALSEFEEGLREAEGLMPGWRHPAIEGAWLECRDSLATSLSFAERLRLEAPDPAGFEGLIGTIGDLLAPLSAFDAAVERFRELRT